MKNKKDKKLLEKYGDMENKGFEGSLQKMLNTKATKPVKNKGKNKS